MICPQHPLHSTLISHPSHLLPAFHPKCASCSSQAQPFHTSLLLYMLSHLPGMPLNGKRNPILSFQPIPTHPSRLRLNSASPGEPSTNSSESGLAHSQGAVLGADLHELLTRAVSRGRGLGRGPGREGPRVLRTYLRFGSRHLGTGRQGEETVGANREAGKYAHAGRGRGSVSHCLV